MQKLSFVLHFVSLGYIVKQVFQNKFWLNEERNPGLMPVCVCVCFLNFTIDRNWWNQKLTKLHGNQAPYNESLSVTEMRKTGKCYISDAFRIEISLLETDLAMQISHKDLLEFRQWRLAHWILHHVIFGNYISSRREKTDSSIARSNGTVTSLSLGCII